MPLSVLKSKSFLIFFLIANILFYLSNIPLINYIQKNPKDTVFTLFQPRFSADYNGYLSAITMGQNGFNYFRNPYTTEKAIPSIFYIYYIMIGKISGIFHIWPPIAYHAVRIISMELFIIFSYIFIYLFFGKKWTLTASLMFIFANIAPPFIFQKDAFVKFQPWWANYDAIRRFDIVPHYLFGQLMLIISLTSFFYFISRHSDRKKECHCEASAEAIPLELRLPRCPDSTRAPRNDKNQIFLIISCISTFSGAIVFPPSQFPILFTLPLSYIVYILINCHSKRSRGIPMNIGIPPLSRWTSGSVGMTLFLIVISVSLALGIGFLQSRQGYHKAVWVDWEVARWNRNEPDFNKQMILTYGILPLITIPAIVYILKDPSFENIFILLWAYLPVILLPFVDIFSISKIRLMGFVHYLPLGMLSVLSMKYLVKKTKKRLIVVLIPLLILSFSLPVSADILIRDDNMSITAPLYTNIFYSRDLWDAIEYIKNYAPKNSVFICNENVGNILPAFTPTISYFAHINLTINFFDKQGNTYAFFTHKFTDEEALNFVRKNGITHVYLGWEEKTMAPNGLNYPFLKTVYEKGSVIIYKVL